MSGSTQIPVGHPMARKVFGAALFAEMVRAPGQFKMLTGPDPGETDAVSKLEKMQTSADYPIVRVTDLSKSAGDVVTVDLFNILQGKPVMGDTRMEGKLMGISSNTAEVRIDQIRAGIDTGGRMAQQRTLHNLRTVGKAGLRGYWARMMSQIKLIHLCGARGTYDSPRWHIPLDSDADFTDIMVNAVTAPTYNRHFYAGDATGLGDMDAADLLTLDDIDKMRVRLEEFEVPLQPIKLPDDPSADDTPLYCMLVSPRVWHHLETATGATSWRTFLQNAHVRGSNNPLFKGGAGMWNGILVKKMADQWIEFASGTSVTVATSADTYTETTVSANTLAHRSVILGAQALAEVFGKHGRSQMHMDWAEEEVDFGNAYQAVAAAMGGYKKLRFRDSEGKDFDHGVVVIDSAAPVVS